MRSSHRDPGPNQISIWNRYQLAERATYEAPRSARAASSRTARPRPTPRRASDTVPRRYAATRGKNAVVHWPRTATMQADCEGGDQDQTVKGQAVSRPSDVKRQTVLTDNDRRPPETPRSEVICPTSPQGSESGE